MSGNIVSLIDRPSQEAKMEPKTILAVLNAEDDMSRVLEAALPLAARFGAHLIGFHAEALPLPQATAMGFPDVELVQAGAEAARQRSAKLKVAFDERIRRDGASAEWHATEGYSGNTELLAVRAARAADLVIVQQTDPDSPYDSAPSAETLLFESGRPVMFVPYAGRVDTRFRNVLVAWNGTHEAARATFDALPFIVQSETTEVLCVDPRSSATEDATFSGADIAEALSRHGAKVTLNTEVSAGLAPGEIIENRIAETGADLLVMGAFSQPWLKQFFFGGATRTLLRSMPTATLMSR
jgi:nucleotide-binding universal stress UspA family protein